MISIILQIIVLIVVVSIYANLEAKDENKSPQKKIAEIMAYSQDGKTLRIKDAGYVFTCTIEYIKDDGDTSSEN